MVATSTENLNTISHSPWSWYLNQHPNIIIRNQNTPKHKWNTAPVRHNCTIYRVSQEEWTKLWQSVPYVELYRYNPKHLYPKLNGYRDNGLRKVWTSCISVYCTSTALSHWPWQCNKSRHLCDCTSSAQHDKTVLHYYQIFMLNVKCLVTLRTTMTWVRVFL